MDKTVMVCPYGHEATFEWSTLQDNGFASTYDSQTLKIDTVWICNECHRTFKRSTFVTTVFFDDRPVSQSQQDSIWIDSEGKEWPSLTIKAVE